MRTEQTQKKALPKQRTQKERIKHLGRSLPQTGRIKGTFGRPLPPTGRIKGIPGRSLPQTGRIKGIPGRLLPPTGRIKGIPGGPLPPTDRIKGIFGGPLPRRSASNSISARPAQLDLHRSAPQGRRICPEGKFSSTPAFSRRIRRNWTARVPGARVRGELQDPSCLSQEIFRTRAGQGADAEGPVRRQTSWETGGYGLRRLKGLSPLRIPACCRRIIEGKKTAELRNIQRILTPGQKGRWRKMI